MLMPMPIPLDDSDPSSPDEQPEADKQGHHENCQRVEGKWLVLTNIYEKFHRSNVYDIGGTCEFWFTYKTEQVGDTFLLHIFAAHLANGHYSIGLSKSNDLSINKKNGHIYLPEEVIMHNFTSMNRKQTYITTYNFTSLDIQLMKYRCLHITIKFPSKDTTNKDAKIGNISCQDFSALLDDPVGSDFIVECEDDSKFKVHKIILCSRSDVFKAMLKSDTAESQNNCVRLLEASGDDVHAMIEFIYTGTIKDMESVNFGTLLMLADKYNINGLDCLCTMALTRQLSIENAIDTLILSDLHSSPTLKLNTMKFIKENCALIRCNAFTEITNVDLLKELCVYLTF